MTPTDDRPNSYPMSPEDRDRVARLYEEITGRIEEIALIGERVIGTPIHRDAVRKFSPRTSATTTFGYDVDVEIVCGPTACGCIYRDADGHWAWQYPCA